MAAFGVGPLLLLNADIAIRHGHCLHLILRKDMLYLERENPISPTLVRSHRERELQGQQQDSYRLGTDR